MRNSAIPKAPSIHVYVECVASQKAGLSHGRWIDTTLGAEHIRGQIAEMLKASPQPDATEWVIVDDQGFTPAELCAEDDVEYVAALATFIDAHGTLGAELVARHGGNLDLAGEELSRHYVGAYPCVNEWARQHLVATGQLASVPEELRPFFAFDRWARDMVHRGKLSSFRTEDGKVHVFWRG